MNQSQSVIRWILNIVLFILVVLLSVTGLINWVLPGGGAPAAGIGSFIHHFTKEVHEVAAVLFMAAVFIHIWLHWAYVTTHLKRLRKTP